MIEVRPKKGASEPLVLASPPLGRSGEVRVRKPVLDALNADLAALGPHVTRVRAKFVQGVEGKRVVFLTLDLGEDFPIAPEKTLARRLQALEKAGKARTAAVLGKDFQTFVSFGGKKLR